LPRISLSLNNINFNRCEPLIRKLFHQLQVLRISTSDDNSYLDAKRWQGLILTSMPYLRIFDFQYNDFVKNTSNDKAQYYDRVDQFNSPFWSERRWFFAHQSYEGEYVRVFFYSTQPYRRQSYTLYSTPEPRRQETNFDIVRHVHIKDEQSIINRQFQFSKATELTLLQSFRENCDSFMTALRRIIPLTQLTSLTIACNDLFFGTIVELLHLAPNIQTLTVDSEYLSKINPESIQQTETFRLVSNENKIQSLIISRNCSSKVAQLFVDLCPRVQHIIIDISRKDFESTIRALLMKHNMNSRHLSSLTLRYARAPWYKKLKNMIATEKFIDNYSIKFVNYKLYLWW